MKASFPFSPDEDSTRIPSSGEFRLITERTCPILVVSTTDVFSSTISGLSLLDANSRTRLDAGRQGQCLQDGCRVFAWKFFQIQQQGHKQARVAVHLCRCALKAK
ncbi:hypothetical protein TNCV_1624411 [Trichonephila clavipes]|nr:hypothetical protein TNCV_1624411 [Trichonephila clavipes]